MFKRLGVPTLAMAAALAGFVPGISMARDRDDHRGGERHEVYRGRDDRGRDYDRDRDRGRGGLNLGFGFYTAPAPVASGYYDRYGNWHPYGYYQPYSPYGY